MRKVRGVSFVELLIAMAVILTIIALSVPSVLRAIRWYRLNSNARGVADLLQRGRYEAIKGNRTVAVRMLPGSAQVTLYVDLDGNMGMGTTEPRVVLASDIGFVGGGEVPSTDSMGYGTTSVPGGAIAFDSRGTVNFQGGPPAVYVLFLGFPAKPESGFRAISLIPAGKMRVWRAETGGVWSDN